MGLTKSGDRANEGGLSVRSFDCTSHQEHHISITPLPGESIEAIVRRLADVLRNKSASVVTQEVFGRLSANAQVLRCLEGELGRIEWPVTWIDGSGSHSDVCGMYVFAVSGRPVDTLRADGRVVGRIYDDGHSRHCLLGDLKPVDSGGTPAAQTRETFELMERALRAAGMAATDLVRTWFFLDGILTWYDQFNPVRSSFFRERNIFGGLVPASTGVGGRNPAGAALIARAWAVQSRDEVVAEAVPSPLQCPSLDYGSAFSRAVLVKKQNVRHLTVSGTASIRPDGITANVGDVKGQVALAMQVVDAILVSRGFAWSDVTRATAYFENLRNAPVLERWLAENNVQLAPVVLAQDQICRSDLLFELELDAIMHTGEADR